MVLVAFLTGGSLLMYLVMLYCRRYYPLKKLVLLLFTVLLTLSGFASVKLMFFVENGRFGGLSFFGAVFFVPLFLLLVSFLLAVEYRTLLDMAAPAICVMLALMKVQCMIYHCCRGMLIKVAEDGSEVRFPSEIVEMVTALLLMVFLVWVMRKEKYRNLIYPLFMVTYGGTRFILNYFRETKEFILNLAPGNFWGLVAVILGLCWICIARRTKKTHPGKPQQKR